MVNDQSAGINSLANTLEIRRVSLALAGGRLRSIRPFFQLPFEQATGDFGGPTSLPVRDQNRIDASLWNI